jgi:hypothetical protein
MKKKSAPRSAIKRTSTPKKISRRSRTWKPSRAQVILILAAIFLPFIYELVNLLFRFPLVQFTMGLTTPCSWIKQQPQNWSCDDNWDDAHRVVTIRNGEKYLRLDIGKASVACIPLLPISFLVKPSPSGLAIPNVCWNGYQMLYQAQWKQDGWIFQLTGSGVSRQFFMSNLLRIGQPAETEFQAKK